MDCGPACLRMIAKFYGKHFSLPYLREKSFIDREGVSLLGISYAAEAIGFRTMSVKIPFQQLLDEDVVPFIAHWRQKHFVVVYKVKKNKVYVADPAHGLVTMSRQEFCDGWISDSSDNVDYGIALLLETTPPFYETEGDKNNKNSWGFLLSYLYKYKGLLAQLVVGLFAGSIIMLIGPFLTQSLVDMGIQYRDYNLVNLILFAMLAMFAGQLSIEFIRGWILLHLSARINISLISDFLIKLMKLPLGFFDTKMVGDILQRINDHARVKEFLTTSTLSSIFSVFNLLVFGVVLFIYNSTIFSIYLGGSILYVVWIFLFLNKRKELDYKMFDQLASNQSKIYQIIQGIQEIKLTGSETQKRWEWERIQAGIFRVNIKNLSLEQWQSAGASVINQTKNILITYVAAKAVISGVDGMTLGMMLAIQYIIGQMNAPLNQLVGFIQAAQYARISLDRIGEIHNKEEEEEDATGLLQLMPESKSIVLENVSFQYSGPDSDKVLDNINIVIPEGKVTAIVGTSGSGKTTLIKLLLKFYKPQQGDIRAGNIHLNNISARLWRSHCGTVMQDGYIFSDTIARNIAVGEENINKRRLLQAVHVANIQAYIEAMPLGYNTKIGQEGIGLSQGQKQRLLIARTVYKNPDYFFFDEATNALDANNEKVIVENLQHILQGKTAVIVAHRLSTVKNADNIIVLEKGKVIEQGTHNSLVSSKGAYYNLVKNQLELGN